MARIQYFKLTPSEFALIAERLAVPDCIADALTDHCEGESPAVTASREEIETRCAAILADGPGTLIATTLDYLIIHDAIEGSTIFGNLEKGTAEYRRIDQHARNIERKFRQEFGEQAAFPRM